MLTELTIRGLVQGVGFRPFIYRLAGELGISGTVANHNHGVIIRARLSRAQCDAFVARIRQDCPPVAVIRQIHIASCAGTIAADAGFQIIPSDSASDEITQVAPDIATCPACLQDRQTQAHRLHYPFINCTHCGPRFSIIQDLPYDRSRTTMSSFPMCPECQREYDDLNDRRFHAQPVACNHCGPVYAADYQGSKLTEYISLLTLTTRLLSQGGVLAVKGIGGYHLVCDATNENAVARLRAIKVRDHKPFAVMFRDRAAIEDYSTAAAAEWQQLSSWRRPIVLLKQRRPLASGINPGMQTLGCMLPYLPLHYDWFQRLATPALVMTSGNLSDLPIAISQAEADQQFAGKVDLLLHHNREIYNRADDSVLHFCGGQACLIRRSRGYAPEPWFADSTVDGLLAFGAEQLNTFALGKEDTILQSQYIGDLKNWETRQFYSEALARFLRLFRHTPQQLICDLHPEYLSTREAEKMAIAQQLPLLQVQHHHAHAAACMLEYHLHEPILAVIWDGTGLGDDGNIWGGEFFLCDRRQYQRLAHLDYVPMPGGDKAAQEPWRMAVAYLRHYQLPVPPAFCRRIGQAKMDLLTAMLDKKVNSPLSSGAGRLFDALSSLLGLCDVATHQAEAPILLEQCADADFSATYPTDLQDAALPIRALFAGVLDDLQQQISTAQIAAKIHHALAGMLSAKIRQLLTQTGVSKVVISGGCFQNKRLTEQLQQLCRQQKIDLYVPAAIPCNDSGVAMGQIAIGAAQRN